MPSRFLNLSSLPLLSWCTLWSNRSSEEEDEETLVMRVKAAADDIDFGIAEGNFHQVNE